VLVLLPAGSSLAAREGDVSAQNAQTLQELDRILVRDVGDLRDEFSASEGLLDRIRSGFARTDDEGSRRAIVVRSLESMTRLYEARNEHLDRDALARVLLVTIRRGDLALLGSRLAPAAPDAALASTEWLALAFPGESTASLREWYRKVNLPDGLMTWDQFLYWSIVRPVIRAQVPMVSPPDAIEFVAPTCHDDAEACFGSCGGGGFACWDGDCVGARCCASAVAECDYYHGWWECTYEYSICLANIMMPLVPK
jgi:hypothetical protein